jgi:hypothetical protein
MNVSIEHYLGKRFCGPDNGGRALVFAATQKYFAENFGRDQGEWC